jgi:capsular polysaccharide biosynthesis protein
MNEHHQIQMETHKAESYEDEIEIIDILRVIWKWKYFIIVGTIVCGLIATVISLNMSKIYSIDMIFRPGILSFGEQGKYIYIDSPQNIKALVDSEAFNNDILNYLNEIKMENLPTKLQFEVTIPANSDMIKVVYETNNIKQGMLIQNHLRNLLLKNYINMVGYYKNEYDMKIKSLASESEYIKTAIQSKRRNIKNIEKRIDELSAESKLVKDNTANLIRERNKLLSENPKEKNILPALVYSNTIQQNLQLSNNYQNESNIFNQQKEYERQEAEKLETDIANKLNEIKNLQFKKDNIQNLQVLQPPTSSSYPIRPKTLLNIILALIAGFLFFIFLSFLLEYLSKHHNHNKLRL